MRLIKWCFGIIIIIGILVGVVPLAARLYAVYWLEQQGLKAEIKSLSIDFIFGEVEVAGVDISKLDGRRLSVGKLETTLNIPALFQQELRIKKLSTLGLKVNRGLSESDLEEQISHFFENAGEKWQVSVGAFALQHTEVCQLEPQDDTSSVERCISMEGVSGGRFTAGRAAAGWSLQAQSPLRLKKLYYKDHTSNVTIVYLGEAEIRRPLYSSSITKLEQIDLQNFHLIESSDKKTSGVNTPYHTQFSRLMLSDIEHVSMNGNQALNIGFVEATAWRQALHKNENAVIVALEQVRDYFPKFIKAVMAEPLNDGSIYKAQIGKTVIKEGVLAWVDDTVRPSASEVLRNIRLDIGVFDTSKPQDPVTISAVGGLPNDGTVNIRGLVYPFASPARLSLSGNITGVNIEHIRGYTQSLIGESLDSGRVDAKFEANADDGRLEMSASIRLGKVKAGRSQPVRGRGMLVSESFNMLKEGGEYVEAIVIHKHDLASSRSVGEGFGMALRRTLDGMAKQHFGSTGVRLRGGPSTVVMQFEPLFYDTNARSLSGDQAARFDEIVNIMQRKPHLVLKVCPVSTSGEWAAIFNNNQLLSDLSKIPAQQKQTLIDLASARARTLKSTLRTKEVSVDKVKFCDAKIDVQNTGPSYLDVSY